MATTKLIINFTQLKNRQVRPFMVALLKACGSDNPEYLINHFDRSTAARIIDMVNLAEPKLYRLSYKQQCEALLPLGILAEQAMPQTAQSSAITVVEDMDGNRWPGADLEHGRYNLPRTINGAKGFVQYARENPNMKFTGKLTHRMYELLRKTPSNCHLTNGLAPPPFVRQGRDDLVVGIGP